MPAYWKQMIFILGAFVMGYAGTEAAAGLGHKVVFDWQAIIVGLGAATAAQAKLGLTGAAWMQTAVTVAAFVLAYGTIEVATGFRYVIQFDWNAVVAGFSATGLYHGRELIGGITGTVKPST